MTKHTVVVLFYKYFLSSPLREFKDYYTEKLYQHQYNLCCRLKLRGRVLLSIEGINGTVSAEDDATINAYISAMKDFDLIRDCGTPNELEETASLQVVEGAMKLYANIDWKESAVDEGTQEPFPDLKISVVKEIVSTGGALDVDEIPQFGGQHLSPQEFHDAIQNNENVVLIDVRNTFECDIGHFVNPHTGEAAINPQMVTFSSFDATFCSRKAVELRDKKVLMYCTGGIRCEKASAMLKKRGVQDVSQLQGGIHRYLETFGGHEGFFKGKNFVFDQRVALDPTSQDCEAHHSAIVGSCIECSVPFDELSGSRLCTVCRDLVLVCTMCQSKLREYHCYRHSGWKLCYFTFLEIFTEEELHTQRQELAAIRESVTPPSEHKNVRRTLNRQIQKVQDRMERTSAGDVKPHKNALRRCRTCMETTDICDGNCFGFWKHRQVVDAKLFDIEPAPGIDVGDRVGPGPHWNTLRLGDRLDSSELSKTGTVVEIKSWATEGDENDCVAVVWDAVDLQKQEPKIYRWGFIARNRQRMYDVEKI